jgi:hypothetical protein
MPKYTVYASETVFYEYEVEADSKKQARDLVRNGYGEIETPEPKDSRNFEIDYAELKV